MRPHLSVVNDPGASGSKVIAAPTYGRPASFHLHPEIVEVTHRDVLEMGLGDSSNPWSDASVTLPSGQTYFVGHKARQALGNSQVNFSKSTLAIPKTCAVLGALAEHYQLGKQFSVALAQPLPYLEVKDASRLVRELRDVLMNFSFNGDRYSLELCPIPTKKGDTPVLVVPEGTGLLQALRRTGPLDSAAIFLMGHRDLTVLLVSQGKANESASTNFSKIGFCRFVDEVSRRAALVSTPEIQYRLPQMLYKAKFNPGLLQALAKMVVPDSAVPAKLEEIQTAIAEAEVTYWDEVKNWLDDVFRLHRLDLSLVGVGGGAATYFKERIEQYFAGINVLWDGGLDREVAQELPFDRLDIPRYADPFGVWKTLDLLLRKVGVRP